MENDNNTATTNPKLDSGEEPKTNVEPEQQEREDERGENPNLTSATEEEAPRQPSSRRTPFTNLSQVDADLALARTLQEQERAYMMLTMGNSGSDYGSWEAGSYIDDYDDDDEEEEDEEEGDEDEDDDDFGDSGVGGEDDGHGEAEINGTDVDEDAFDVHAHSHGDGGESNARADTDPAAFDSDEAYARALQDAEEREMAARLFALAGIHDINDIIGEAEVIEDHGANSQETWEEVDPDELSYEELLALGEVVGTESRGLSAATIASLPSINYKLGSSLNGSNDSCVICRLDYEDDETLTLLSCKHSYHSECINNWLKINKVCPVCCTEVSTSGHS